MLDIKAPWMHVARALEGESEIAGSAHNPRIVEMFRISGTPQFKSDETAWCAAFVNAVLLCTGYAGTKSALASSFAKFGSDLGSDPVPGCIVLFWPLASGASGHVALFLRDLGDKIEVLGGNQKNKASIDAFDKIKLRSYRMPTATTAIPETTLPTILTLAPAEAPDHVRVGAPIIVPSPGVKPVSGDNFERVHEPIKKWEGGYTDHPRDKGGPTNYGITIGRLAEWRGEEVTADDVKLLSYAEALKIFRADYYDVLRCDEMPIALALMTYNAGVNSGPARGARFLQQALQRQSLDLGPDGVDGEVGPFTLAAASLADIAKAVDDYSAIYEAFYRSLGDFDVFGNGWLNRLRDVTATARSWAGERIAPIIVPTVPAIPPMEPTMPQQPQFPQLDLGQIINVIGMLGGLFGGSRVPIPTFPPTPTQPSQPGQPAPQFNILTLIPVVLSIVSALGGWTQAIRIVTMIITAVAPLLQQMQQQQQR